MTSGVKEVEGVHENVPVLAIESARQSIGMTFSDGPRRRTMETFPVVVGYEWISFASHGRIIEEIRTFHVIVNGFPAGTIWFRVGKLIGLPLGLDPTGSCEQAEARPARAAPTIVTVEKYIST